MYFISNCRIIVEIVSGNVEGWFVLNDFLKVIFVFGDIKFDVVFKVVDLENLLRVELKLVIVLGDIIVIELIDSGLVDDFSVLVKKFLGCDYYVDIGIVLGLIMVNLVCLSYVNIRL